MVNVLAVKEQLTQNLAGDQISHILDRFILSSLRPLGLKTHFLYPIISDILVQTYNDNRRKISILPKSTVVDRLFSALLAQTSTEHWEHFKNARLERVILRNAAQYFLLKTKSYKELQIKYIESVSEVKKAMCTVELQSYESQFGGSIKHLFSIINKVNFYLDYYTRFKHMILEKYIRLAHLESIKVKEMSVIKVDQEGLFENFVLAIDKAIEKYSSEKGALTSYIKYWFMDARNNPTFNCDENQAVTTRSRTRRKLAKLKDQPQLVQQTFAEDFSEYENQIEGSKDLRPGYAMEKQDTVNEIYFLINQIPNIDYAKLIYGVPYSFSEAELKLQKNTLRNK